MHTYTHIYIHTYAPSALLLLACVCVCVCVVCVCVRARVCVCMCFLCVSVRVKANSRVGVVTASKIFFSDLKRLRLPIERQIISVAIALLILPFHHHLLTPCSRTIDSTMTQQDLERKLARG